MNPMMPPAGGMPPSDAMPLPLPPNGAASAPAPSPSPAPAPSGGPQVPPEVALALLQAIAASPQGDAQPDLTGIATPNGEISPEALASLGPALGLPPDLLNPAILAALKLSQPGVAPEDFGAYDNAIGALSGPLGLGGRQLDPQLLAALAEALPENDPSQIPLPNSPQTYGA